MIPDMQYFIILQEMELKMMQQIIIIFSFNQLTRIKTNSCLSYKKTWEIYKAHFQNISSQARAGRLRIVKI